MIAMALALDPKLLIADEPTTALDVTTQAQILTLIRDLQQRKKTAVLFITHDFGVVAEIADRVAVMQHGVVVEQGDAAVGPEQPAASLHQATDRRRAAADGAAAARALRRNHPDHRQRVEDLSHRRLSRPRRARDAGGEGRIAETAARRDARHRRRIRIGQIDAGALHRAADRSGRRLDRARRQGLGEADARGCPPRNPAYPDGVSGSVRVAQSAPQGGRTGRAGSDRARHAAGQGDRRRQGIVRAGRARSIGRRPLSARILRRPAPAHRAGARAGAAARRAGRRRAGLGARRLGAGAGAEAARRTAPAARPFHRLHHPRSARRRADLRPRRGHEGRRGGRARAGRRCLRHTRSIPTRRRCWLRFPAAILPQARCGVLA